MAKIAFFLWDLQKGGAELVSLNVVEKLVQEGFNVDLITLTNINNYPFHAASSYVKQMEKQRYNGKNKLLKYCYYICYFVKLFFTLAKYDAWVAALEFRPSIILYFFSFFLSKPFSIWVHCNLNEYSKTVSKFENFFFQHALAKSNQIVCCSNTCKISLIEYNDNFKDKISVIENLIDFKSYKINNTQYSRDIRSPFTFISVGRLVKLKGFDFLLDSFASMMNKYKPDCHLIICGDGVLKQELKNKIHDLNLVSSVSLVGNVDDIFNYYKFSDLFISSSITESYSLTVIEALYCGLPVIITKTGAQEITNKFNVGDVVNYGDTIELAEAMYKYVNDKSYYKSQKEKIANLDFSNLNDQIIHHWLVFLDNLC